MRFGTRCRWERDVLLYAPTFTGLRVGAVRSGLAAATAGGNRVLRGDALTRLKRGWRDRLARSEGR